MANRMIDNVILFLRIWSLFFDAQKWQWCFVNNVFFLKYARGLRSIVLKSRKCPYNDPTYTSALGRIRDVTIRTNLPSKGCFVNNVSNLVYAKSWGERYMIVSTQFEPKLVHVHSILLYIFWNIKCSIYMSGHAT